MSQLLWTMLSGQLCACKDTIADQITKHLYKFKTEQKI